MEYNMLNIVNNHVLKWKLVFLKDININLIWNTLYIYKSWWRISFWILNLYKLTWIYKLYIHLVLNKISKK